MKIAILPFSKLSLNQLYELLKLRVDIFVVEQQCSYAELDNADQNAIHIMATETDEIIGYARISFKGDKIHIGRIVIKQSHRNKGLGKELMNSAIQYCAEEFPNQPIYLSAQIHLQKYYESFGFQAISDVYDWDGIDHLDMILKSD